MNIKSLDRSQYSSDISFRVPEPRRCCRHVTDSIATTTELNNKICSSGNRMKSRGPISVLRIGDSRNVVRALFSYS